MRARARAARRRACGRQAGAWAVRPAYLFAALLAPCLGGGCVTTILDDEPRTESLAPQVVAIPIAPAGPGGGPVLAYYESVLAQMRDAAAERDTDQLRALLGVHDRPDAPGWAAERMDAFSRLLPVLDYERQLPKQSRFAPRGDAGLVAGQRLPLELVVDALPASPVVLTGTGDRQPTRFLVGYVVTDIGSEGGRTTRRSAALLEVPRRTAAADGLRLPFVLDVGGGASHGLVLQEVQIEAELLPGFVLASDGDRGEGEVPNQRVPCARWRGSLYPAFAAAVRAAPLRELHAALDSGTAEHLPRVFLAARFMPEGDRPAAIDRLMREVKLGVGRSARVAMAALRELTGAPVEVGDREGWLRWWGTKR